jgi:hypothetical protein
VFGYSRKMFLQRKILLLLDQPLDVKNCVPGITRCLKLGSVTYNKNLKKSVPYHVYLIKIHYSVEYF